VNAAEKEAAFKENGNLQAAKTEDEKEQFAKIKSMILI